MTWVDVLLRRGKARQFTREGKLAIERRIYLGAVKSMDKWRTVREIAGKERVSVEESFRFISSRYRDLAEMSLWDAKRERARGDRARARISIKTARQYLTEARRFRRLREMYARLNPPKPEAPADIDLLVEKGLASREDYAE